MLSASGISFVFSSGPRSSHRSGFWQETTFWGRGEGGGSRDSDITSCRSTTTTLSHSKKPYKHKKPFKESSLQEEVLDFSSFDKIRCREEQKVGVCLIRTETGGTGTSHHLLLTLCHTFLVPPGPMWCQRGGGEGRDRGPIRGRG